MKKLRKPRAFEFKVPVKVVDGGEEIFFTELPTKELERLSSWMKSAVAWRKQQDKLKGKKK